MRYTVSNDAHVQLTGENDTTRSQQLVKIAPCIRVKKASQMRISKRAKRIYVNVTQHYDMVKKETRQDHPSSSRNFGNASSSLNNDTSLDENLHNEANVTEIIALLKQARSRSQNSPENAEVIDAFTSELNLPQSPPHTQMSYY